MMLIVTVVFRSSSHFRDSIMQRHVMRGNAVDLYDLVTSHDAGPCGRVYRQSER